MAPPGNGVEQMLRKRRCRSPVGFFNERCRRDLACSVDGNEELKLAFRAPQRRDVPSQGLQGKPLTTGFAPRDGRSTRDAMSLQAGGQRRARRLRGVAAVVQRKQRLPPEGDDHRLCGPVLTSLTVSRFRHLVAVFGFVGKTMQRIVFRPASRPNPRPGFARDACPLGPLRHRALPAAWQGMCTCPRKE